MPGPRLSERATEDAWIKKESRQCPYCPFKCRCHTTMVDHIRKSHSNKSGEVK
jgi:hypothetical protein